MNRDDIMMIIKNICSGFMETFQLIGINALWPRILILTGFCIGSITLIWVIDPRWLLSLLFIYFAFHDLMIYMIDKNTKFRYDHLLTIMLNNRCSCKNGKKGCSHE